MEVDLLLQTYCRRLKLPTFTQNYRKLAQEAAQANQTFEQYLLALLEQEVIQRETNQERRRIQAARFPILRTLDTFDFSAVPTLNKAKILELARGEYITQCENILFVGEIGTGKPQPKDYHYWHNISTAGDGDDHRSSSSALRPHPCANWRYQQEKPGTHLHRLA